MIDMSATIIPKSDQLNADDLIAGSKTIEITGVDITGGDQPVSVSYKGDNKKPWKPCKSMCRVLIFVWGKDGEKYIGQSLTIHRDPDVKWAGAPVGGIRITHMTGLKEKKTMPLTMTRNVKKAYIVQPLILSNEIEKINIDELEMLKNGLNSAQDINELKQAYDNVTSAKPRMSKDEYGDLASIKDSVKNKILLTNDGTQEQEGAA